MCGRFTLTASAAEIARIFGAAPPDDTVPRYNIAPTQRVLCLRRFDRGDRLDYLRWGLVPPWSKDIGIGNRLINARGETAAEKPSFRSAFKRRRCLILADGFFEWKREGAKKRPYRFRMKDERPFAFAGLWEEWTGPNHQDADPLETCTIVTTEANSLLAEVHDRMPVILDEARRERWLDPESDPESLQQLLLPFDSDRMESHPVSSEVNNARNDTPDLFDK